MIRHIPELMESGIDNFKIEGRMKSAYYAAVVTNTYRMAMDAYRSGNYEFNEAWERELESVSHREYATGYYFGDCHEEANTTAENGYIKEKAYLANVVGYDPVSGEAQLIQKNKMCRGDAVELLTPGKVGIPFVSGELFDEAHNPIESTPHPYMPFSMKMPFPVKVGDILRSAK